MPYKSQAQAAFMHIHHPDIAARWDAEYGPKPKKKKGKVTKMDQRVDPFGISKAKSGRASASKTTNVGRSHQVQEASTSPVTDASLGMYGHSAATAVSFKGSRGRQTATRKGKGQLKAVAKNDTLSAFGVDHSYEVSKKKELSNTRTLAGGLAPVAHGAVKGKAGKKGEAMKHELFGAVGTREAQKKGLYKKTKSGKY